MEAWSDGEPMKHFTSFSHFRAHCSIPGNKRGRSSEKNEVSTDSVDNSELRKGWPSTHSYARRAWNMGEERDSQ